MSIVTYEDNLEYTLSTCYNYIHINNLRTYLACPFITYECNHLIDTLLERPAHESCHCSNLKPVHELITNTQVALQYCGVRLFLKVRCHETFNQWCTLICVLHEYVCYCQGFVQIVEMAPSTTDCKCSLTKNMTCSN